jgi:hypothetical protein
MNRGSVEESKGLIKWNDHPVVSTVLWMLGGTSVLKKVESTDSNSKLASHLTWKDENGGHIAEYISVVQGKAAGSHNILIEETTPRLKLKSKGSFQDLANAVTESDSSKSSDTVRSERSRSYTVTTDVIADEITPSPQWGFYVAITPPPPDEVYSKPKSTKSAKAQVVAK